MKAERFLAGSGFGGFTLSEWTLPIHSLQINVAYENMILPIVINSHSYMWGVHKPPYSVHV